MAFRSKEFILFRDYDFHIDHYSTLIPGKEIDTLRQVVHVYFVITRSAQNNSSQGLSQFVHQVKLCFSVGLNDELTVVRIRVDVQSQMSCIQLRHSQYRGYFTTQT